MTRTQSPSATASAGVSQEPPTQPTFGSARYAAAAVEELQGLPGPTRAGSRPASLRADFVSTWSKPGLTRVVKEAVGKASIYDRYLYVTDGGHYDNLGLVEALRRRPERIFVLDASNDLEDTFTALGRAIATARMDLDCEVRMDPRGMRKVREGRSAAGWCSGTFEFAAGGSGTIHLAKAIMLDELSWDIETYSLEHVNFPRTSTTDQMYSEFDFEAYRALGQHAVEKLLVTVPA